MVYDAKTWRPYCHVNDFARLIDIVLSAPKDKVDFEIFNAGGDQNNHTKQEIIDLISTFLKSPKVSYKELGSDPRNYQVNFSKVKKQLGFKPRYSVRDGIVEIINASNNKIFDDVLDNREQYGNYNV